MPTKVHCAELDYFPEKAKESCKHPNLVFVTCLTFCRFEHSGVFFFYYSLLRSFREYKLSRRQGSTRSARCLQHQIRM
jgi:hypothetical protein